MCVWFIHIYIMYLDLFFGWVYRDQTPLTTPERVRSEAQHNKRDQRVLESPEHRRIPLTVQLAQSGILAPHIPPVFMPSAVVPPRAPIYPNLPPHLAQQYAALPDLYPRRQVSVAPQLAPAFVPTPAQHQPVPVPAPQLAPAFVPVPAQAQAQYPNLPADLAQRLASLPPLMEHGRGRGRGRGRPIGRGNNIPVTAPMPYAELAAQYAALPPVCVIFVFICEFMI